MTETRPGKLGTSMRRLEDPRLVTGAGNYVDDLRPDRLAHVAFIRSTEPHALIDSIDTEEALRMPGVLGVFTAAELELTAPMPNPYPHPALIGGKQASPLAEREVCYVGEPIAVVVAETRYQAADAAEAVFVDYQPLPSAGTLRAARAGNAPMVNLGAQSNVVATLEAAYGDVAGAFATADHVVPLALGQHRGACASMETRGVVAERHAHGVTVWTSSQGPYTVKKMLSAYFGRDDLRVIAPDVGGGFGPKGGIYAEEYVLTALALTLDRPVKWIETRREHFLTTQQQRDMVAELEVAASADGRMLGLRGTIWHDNGAYVPYGLLLPMTGFQLIQGPYLLEAMDLRMHVVATNAVPTSPIRGAARPNAAFISERAADAVARATGIERAEIRRLNFIPRDRFPYEFPLAARYGGNITYDSGSYHEALDKVLDLADAAGFPARKAEAAAHGRRLGLGIAAYVEDTGLGPHESVRVDVLDDGTVDVVVGTGSQGQGHATVYAQIVSTELDIDPRLVRLRSADTELAGTGVATVASRTAVTAGSSAALAARTVADHLRDQAAEHLEASPADLVFSGGSIQVAGSPGSSVTIAELAGAAGGTISAEETHPMPRPPYASGCHVAEVEVDVETGLVTVLHYSVAHDCGTVLNPMIVEGQIDGGVAHGLSNALLEQVSYTDEGHPLSTTFMDFRIPTAVEMPPLSKVHVETPSPDNPLGAKGAGEGGTIPAAAAIVSAVEDALADLGVVVDRYPLHPSVVRDMIERSHG